MASATEYRLKIQELAASNHNSEAAKEMAGGSLGVNITYDSKDELGSLAVSMNTLCAVSRVEGTD